MAAVEGVGESSEVLSSVLGGVVGVGESVVREVGGRRGGAEDVGRPKYSVPKG